MAYQNADTIHLNMVTSNAQDVLIAANATFPFSLFPDTIVIDRVKATITKRRFIQMAEVISIQIEDILNVEADVGPLFGKLKLWTRFFGENALEIEHLSRKDALAVKQVLQGYIIARHKGIDCAKIETNELVPLLHSLGAESSRR